MEEQQNPSMYLKTYSKQNKFVTKAKITDEDQQILDNIWNMKTPHEANKQKLSILYTLVQRFTTDKQRKFLYYGLFTGPDAGIYSTWEQMIKYIQENPRLGTPLYKGFASFDEDKTKLQKKFEDDYVVSEDIQSLQNISLGKLIKTEIPKTSTNLKPQTSFATVIKTEKNNFTNLGKPYKSYVSRKTYFTKQNNFAKFL